MWPKWPAQSAREPPQVAQAGPLEETPRRGSRTPLGAGLRSGILFFLFWVFQVFQVFFFEVEVKGVSFFGLSFSPSVSLSLSPYISTNVVQLPLEDLELRRAHDLVRGHQAEADLFAAKCLLLVLLRSKSREVE